MTGADESFELTVEISMYPVRDDYLAPIKGFIAQIGRHADLEIETTPTSTRIVGDYARVMAVLEEAMAVSYREFGTAVFVAKLIPGYAARRSSG